MIIFRALPSNAEEREEFQVPPGMTMKSYKRIVEKNVINANQLEEVRFLVFCVKIIFSLYVFHIFKRVIRTGGILYCTRFFNTNKYMCDLSLY